MSTNRIINWAAKAKAAYVGHRTDFYNALEHAKGMFMEIATEVPSNSPEETYHWLGDLPTMREWIGERVVHALRAEAYTIKNKDWEATVRVGRDDIRYDKHQKVLPTIQMLAQAAPRKKDALCTDLLTGGFDATGGLAYDGQFFFDSDHTTGGNGSGSSYSNVTDAVFDSAGTAFEAARQNMDERVDDHGEPLEINGDTLVFGPSLRGAVETLIDTKTVTNGGDNRFYKAAKPVLNKRLIGSFANYWFLLDTSKPVKPLLVQQVGGINFVPRSSMQDDNMFWHKDMVYGADGTFNAGYTLPQLAFGSDGSA